ncbi:MAG: hypothetical protein ABIG43_01665 [Chloroflexota bacterium]
MKIKFSLNKNIVFLFLIFFVVIFLGSTYTLNKSASGKSLFVSTPEPSRSSFVDSQIQDIQYALSQDTLSPELRLSLEEKLKLLSTYSRNIAASRSNPLPKDGRLSALAPSVENPPFISGIFPEGEHLLLPYKGFANNYWQGEIDGKYLHVIAGAISDKDSAGAIFLIITSADRRNSTFEIFKAPEGIGSLSIQSIENNTLWLEDEEGQVYLFDLLNMEILIQE